MANSTVFVANAENHVEVYQNLMTKFEAEMDRLITLGDSAQAEVAKLRAEINILRAKIGMWRGEASFWRNELNESKSAVKETNKLATSN